MSDRTVMGRRGFLRSSGLMAAAAGLAAAVPLSAQEQSAPEAKTPAEEKKPEAERKPEGSTAKKLVDKDGREYRVCDMCGGNMYSDGKLWTCEQCGFSYEV